MTIVLLILAGFVVVASVLPLVQAGAWWIRAFDFPRLIMIEIGLVVLLGGAFLWNWSNPWHLAVAGLLALALVLQFAEVFPYTPLAPKQSERAETINPDSTISIMVANVLMTNRETARFLEMVEEMDPDILVTLEPDAWWEDKMRPIEERLPHTIKEPLDNLYGMILYSRFELIDPETRYLIKEGIPSMHMQVQLPSGRRFHFHALHPEPPAPGEAKTSKPRDAELLLVGKLIKDRDEPTIVAGDLNDVAWSHTTSLFQKVSGMLDPRRGRGMYNTFSAHHFYLRWPLDHIFHSDHLTLVEMRRLDAFGSDHFPVYIELHLDPLAEAMQDEPDADSEDLQEADRKIQEGREQEAKESREEEESE